jgi:HlyD family secretion protein
MPLTSPWIGVRYTGMMTKPTAFQRMTVRARRLLLLAVAAAIGIALFAWWRRPPRVQVAQPVRRDVVTSVATTGTVETVTVSPGSETGGRIERLWVREGELVAAGQLLATLDTRELEARLREAQTALESARLKEAATSEASWRPQRELAEAAVAQARLRVGQAERDSRDLSSLAARGAVPRVDAENARVALQTARSQLQEAEARLRQLDLQARDERRQASIGVQAAQAALDTLRTQLARMRIISPVAGVVTEINARSGETLPPGGPLLKIARLDTMRIAVQLDEQYLARVHPGQTARMATDAFPNEPFEGHVEKINPAVDPERGTIKVLLRPENIPMYLRPEMTIDVNIITGRYPQALTIPRAALVGPAGARRVWVVTEDGRAEPRFVEVVLGDAGDVAVLRGLAPDDRVILSPPRLRAGQRVFVVERTATGQR